jgi:hypothetical protein
MLEMLLENQAQWKVDQTLQWVRMTAEWERMAAKWDE